MKKIIYGLLALTSLSSLALANDPIRILGSSTVYPFTTAVAEQFAKKTGAPTPIIEATGTGGGIKIFCQGEGPGTIDAVNASRPIKQEEMDACAQAGVNGITEIVIGLDAIVLAMAKEQPPMNLATSQIYSALAKYVIVDGQFIENPTKTWSDLDPSLPNTKIEVLGPPPTSGTRDSFVELVVEKECKLAIKDARLTITPDDEKKFCRSIREDGAFVEAGENDNLIVQKIQNNPTALGIFGYSFLEENTNVVQGVSINGVVPSYEEIEAGKYPVARKLYVYFKNKHLENNPDLKAFMEEYQSEEAIGEEGYLVDKGLLPIIE